MTLAEREESFLNQSIAKLFGMALALLFIGKQEKCEATIEALGIVQHPISKYSEVAIESLAYIGTGNVLKV